MPDQPNNSAEAVVAAYFQPPQGSFWRWAEDNEVIEWANGTTITYRAELAALLAGLAPGGLPPLGPVLLLLAACTDAWQDSTAEIGLLQGLLRGLPNSLPPDDSLMFHLSVARSFLDIVRQLPPTLRQGIAKEHLLREVLGKSDEIRLMAAEQARPLAARLRAGATDASSFTVGSPFSRLRARRDLLAFDYAARRFPTVHSLELRLRTGLDQLPAPLTEALPPPPPAPAPLPADLLADLAQDAQTAGLARLVPHLRAALHLPQPARQAGRQPLGGVANLTNRGPLDRLLLSELAQDDLALLARLAHGEALYLRREAPPLPQPPPRVLLLDTTLQMWGLPRVAGLAAALALALPPAAGAGQPAALAFALGGLTAQQLDLRTRPGVIAALGHLDAALHCGAALPGLLPTLPAQAEAVLITEAQAARQPAFLAQLREAPPALRFLLTVARSGELALYELTGGRRTLLSSSQVEWEKVLFPPRPAAPHQELVLPAFLQQARQPLFFPTVSFRASSAMMRYQVRRGVIGVTQHLRVLYWPHSYHGALEALPLVEEGTYHFGFSVQMPNNIYLLVTQASDSETKTVILYTFRPWESSAERVDLSAQVPAAFTWTTVLYKNDSFILKGGYQAHFIDCQQPALQPYKQFAPPAPAPPASPPRSFFNPGYGVMQKLNHLSISPTGHLLLDTHELAADAGNNLLLRPATIAQPDSLAATHAGTFPLAASPRVRLRRWVWPNGSEAFVDTRGLLHLRSANASLPQVTIVLITNRTTAAWEEGGRLCGSSHFVCEWSYFKSLPHEPVPGQREAVLPVAEFYAQYIQPFIDHLR